MKMGNPGYLPYSPPSYPTSQQTVVDKSFTQVGAVRPDPIPGIPGINSYDPNRPVALPGTPTRVPYSPPSYPTTQQTVADRSFYQTYAARGAIPVAAMPLPPAYSVTVRPAGQVASGDSSASMLVQLLVLAGVGYAGYAYGREKKREEIRRAAKALASK